MLRRIVVTMSTLLLAVHCKKTDSLDLKTPIWNYIANTYSDQQANDASDDLAVVQQLRGEVVGLTGSLQQLRETLAKYALGYPDRHTWDTV